MLRLPPYQYHRPDRLDDALALLDTHEEAARVIAGGTDLLPNMKHGLLAPDHLVSIRALPELQGIREEEDGAIRLGAGCTLHSLATHPLLRTRLPALAEAAGHVAGPQLRNMGTLGGNLCLDTRCTYYNQSEFWRKALGYCLKKDGDTCHVTRVGRVCVAAHSADTPPILIALGADIELASPRGTRRLPVADFFVADGIRNLCLDPGEIVVALRIPPPPEPPLVRRTAYGKLRLRKSIDFPLLTVGLAATTGPEGNIESLEGVVTGLGSRPRVLTRFGTLARGEVWSDELVEALAERAHAQCTPLESHIVDPEWRKAMVPVMMRRTLAKLRTAP